MKVRMTAVAAILILPLALSACGGSSSSDVRDKAITDMTKSLTDSGAPQTVIDCMTNLMKNLSDDDVTNLDKDTASQELKDKFMADSAACATAG